MKSDFCSQPDAGFTIIELVTVLIVIGIVGAIGVGRFFDNRVFENRAYADQAKAIIRYAQKLAIAQNRFMYVRADGNSFAVCSGSGCAAAEAVTAPAGSNSGSSVTKANCLLGGAYVAQWLCEGRPASVTVNAGGRAEVGAGGYFFFDALGRPYNKADSGIAGSTFNAPLAIIFASGGNSAQITIYPETGYVQ